MGSSRKKCNFCNHASVTVNTKHNDELYCSKRRLVVYTDDKCDFFDDMRSEPKRTKSRKKK